MPAKGYRIAVLGLWHLGEVYSAGLAALGQTVTGIDDDPAVVAGLSRGVPPLPEPGLASLIANARRAGRLSYTTDLRAIERCGVVWLTFDTPVDRRDHSDLGPMMRMLHKVIPHLKNDVLLVVSSQIPAGTSKRIQDLVKRSRPRLKFHYAYSPENLRLGEAVRCFLRPERVVVGTDDDEAARRLETIFRGTQARTVRMSAASAEMAKHALNAFLATSISFANDIADACEAVGADVADVMRALRSDPRIGERAALGAGLGFSGGTLGRDLVSLLNIAKGGGVSFPVIQNVLKKNASRPAKLVRRAGEALRGLKKKRIVLLGLTYKPGTTTLRRSRSLEVAALFGGAGAEVVLSDHHVPQHALPRVKNARIKGDPYEAARGAHALIFLTPWSDFRGLDFKKLARNARRGAVVIDGTNFLYDKEGLIRKAGFKYYGIGR